MESRERAVFIWNKGLSRVMRGDCCITAEPRGHKIIGRRSTYPYQLVWLTRFIFYFSLIIGLKGLCLCCCLWLPLFLKIFLLKRPLTTYPLRTGHSPSTYPLHEPLQFLELCITGQILTEEFLEVKSFFFKLLIVVRGWTIWLTCHPFQSYPFCTNPWISRILINFVILCWNSSLKYFRSFRLSAQSSRNF